MTDRSHSEGARSTGLVLHEGEGSEFRSYDTKNRPHPVRSHAELARAFEYFNCVLFGGTLPPCLITLEPKRRSYGHFVGDRFFNIGDPSENVDQINLSSAHFADERSTNVLSTLVHEMTHLQQHHFGKPSRGSYHNSQWANMMQAIGLIPSSTGKPGGKKTGDAVSHYIEPGGRFEIACADYLATNELTLFQDRECRGPTQFSEDEGSYAADGRGGSRFDEAERARLRKAASKTRFTCPRCLQNAWGSRRLRLICGNDDCDQERMVS